MRRLIFLRVSERKGFAVRMLKGKVREVDSVVKEVNCLLASRAEKILKEKQQQFMPRSVRDSLSQFAKPKPHVQALFANKRQFLKDLLQKSEHGHDWRLSLAPDALNLQLACSKCSL